MAKYIRQIFTVATSVIFLLFSCKSENKDEDSFLVNGNISENFEGYIYLKYGEDLDSSLVQNSKFQFKGNVEIQLKPIFILHLQVLNKI